MVIDKTMLKWMLGGLLVMAVMLLIETLTGCANLERTSTPSDDQPPVSYPDASVQIPDALVLPDASAPDACQPQCSCDDDCGHGQTCRQGKCYQRCWCDNQCTHDEACRYGVCRPD